MRDAYAGTLDAWWIRDALSMCGYTFVAQWTTDGDNPSGEPTDPTEPEAPTEPSHPTEPDPERPELPDALRISGGSRYETSFAIADTLKEALRLETFDNIIIASGLDFADALSGSYLAAVKKAPILITNGMNGEALCSYIQKNWSGNGKVYILGGTIAVPEDSRS